MFSHLYSSCTHVQALPEAVMAVKIAALALGGARALLRLLRRPKQAPALQLAASAAQTV